MAHATMDSPVGGLVVMTTSIGVSRLWWKDRDGDKGDSSAAATQHLEQAVVELNEYFAGSRNLFDVSIDRRARSGFGGQVLDALEEVAFGHTVKYGELAQRIGRANAARAVGTAVARNPIAIIVPCHRVVPAGGGVGQFGGGVPAKEWLLRREDALD